MNINKNKITSEMLITLIRKEHILTESYLKLSNISTEYNQQLSILNKEQKDLYASLINFYETQTRNTIKNHLPNYIMEHDNQEKLLSTCVNVNLELLSFYTSITNNEIDFSLKNYFTNFEKIKIRHSLILNHIFSDFRGCNCHKNKRAVQSSSTNNNELMNLYWEQHVWWTRNLIISIIDEIKDENEVTNRLLKNPDDIASLFKPKYGVDISNKIKDLITQHLVIGKNLIVAVKQNNSFLTSELNTKWYKNADDIANALNSINPHAYSKEKWTQMLYSHLDMTKKEVEYRLNKKYHDDIINFDYIEKEALVMAKEMLKGL